ncbi:hypothetical protein BDZ97DRAFT_1832033 [Flammula alnicola]|nr:hypothetical protein BDZ97DRAFT_1832033 [Flammula alnicola]
MQRRSNRLLEKYGVNSSVTDVQLLNVGSILHDGPEPRKKKARGTKRKMYEDKESRAETHRHVKKTRGTDGRFDGLVEMPLDVLYEIFGLLNPSDLLHLARAAKALRGVLMTRSAIFVWKLARSNIEGPPPCPDDLNEPQYANLLFADNCHFCLRTPSIVTIVWSARVRCCSKCLHRRFVKVTGNWASDTVRGYPEMVAQWVPSVKVTQKTGVQTIYALKSIDRIWKNEYARIADCTDGTTKYDWVTAKLNERRAIESHARDCNLWWMKMQPESDTHLLVDRRKALVIEYLKELGWGEELSKIPPLDNSLENDRSVISICQQEVSQFGLSIFRSSLEEVVQDFQRKRLLQEHTILLKYREHIIRRIVAECARVLPVAHAIYPPPSELFRITTEDPSLVDYSKEYPEAIRVTIPEIALRWQKDIEDKLRGLITSACPEYMFDPSTVLDLATTFFCCDNCDEVMRHDHAMMHGCATRIHSYLDLYQRASSEVLQGVNWNSGICIKFRPDILQLITRVVELSGFNPTTTTAREMDEANPIFECVDCDNIETGRATMSWATVVSYPEHSCSRDTGNGLETMNLKVLDEQEATKVRERIIEEDARRKRSPYYSNYFCRHCKWSFEKPCNFSQLRTHLKTVHDIRKPRNEDMAFRHVPHSLPVFRLWPPREEESDAEGLSMAQGI